MMRGFTTVRIWADRRVAPRAIDEGNVKGQAQLSVRRRYHCVTSVPRGFRQLTDLRGRSAACSRHEQLGADMVADARGTLAHARTAMQGA